MTFEFRRPTYVRTLEGNAQAWCALNVWKNSWHRLLDFLAHIATCKVPVHGLQICDSGGCAEAVVGQKVIKQARRSHSGKSKFRVLVEDEISFWLKVPTLQ